MRFTTKANRGGQFIKRQRHVELTQKYVCEILALRLWVCHLPSGVAEVCLGKTKLSMMMMTMVKWGGRGEKFFVVSGRCKPGNEPPTGANQVVSLSA